MKDHFSLESSEVLNLPVEVFHEKIKDNFEEPEKYLEFVKQATYSRHKNGSLNILELARSGLKLLRPKEMQIAVLPKDIHNKDGILIGKMLTYADITEFHRTSDLIQTVVEASPVPTIVSSLKDGEIIFVNKPLADLFDLTTDEAIGSKAPDFYADPADREEVVRRLKEDGFLKNHEVRMKKPDGETVWMIFNFIITKLAGKAVIVGTFYEISERKKAEEKLLRSEERFRQLAENIGELFWMTTPDKRELIYLNRMYEVIFGRDKSEIYSDPSKWLDFVHEDDRERIESGIERQVKGEYAEEYRIVRPDGMVRWVSEYAYPIKDEDGEIHRLCGVIRDITKRKEAQKVIATRLRYEEGLANCSQALIGMEEIGKVLKEALSSLLVAADVERVYIFENFQDAEDGICMRRHNLVSSRDIEENDNDELPPHLPYKNGFTHWLDELSSDKPISGIMRKLSKLEQEVFGQNGVQSILLLPIWVGGDWYGFIGFDDMKSEREWNDEDIRLLRTAAEMIGGFITRRSIVAALRVSLADLEKSNKHLRETQAQLVQSEKMASLGMLVAGIAHEINTPIGAVNSMHNTLIRALDKLHESIHFDEKRKEEDEKFHSIFKIIKDANRVITSGTERVTEIVSRLRSFARLDEAEIKEINVHHGLDDTITLIHHEIKHNIKINRNYGDCPLVSCYPARLNQVFLNILINAKQSIEGKGEITIKTYHRDGKVYIEFRDTGIGIPTEDLKRIFDPGYTTKGVGVGTGLWLSICYRIIQDHHGEIRVTSEVGKGTTFTIVLPVSLDEILADKRS